MIALKNLLFRSGKSSFSYNLSLFFLFAWMIALEADAQSLVAPDKKAGSFVISSGSDLFVYVDMKEEKLVRKSAEWLAGDIEKVTGKKPKLVHDLSSITSNTIIIGTAGLSSGIKQLNKKHQLGLESLNGKWEGYQMHVLPSTGKNNNGTMLIAGSDRRGVAFGVFELSKQIGVSPWNWWADVPVQKKKEIYFNPGTISDAPKVKYRGIFINDEAPALSGWTREKFGGFNHKFYEKVFELILRLKGNYIWPAMWGNAFYADDSMSIHTADEYGIVIGTSHHEPLMRAHAEWNKFGSGPWNYEENPDTLRKFWRGGMQRSWNEKVVTIGMRGDGDEPMSKETATALLENIVDEQRKIIAEVTGRPASETPQLWALYKEVQDYYDKGMRVPDDVTLLLCDDNWGNIRRLPKLTDKKRKGGYGIYYHFDYVGGPRNYKWLNTNAIPRIWEQMHLAWEHDVRDIWIVNVGDIKPMELPISFFLDYAWNPEAMGADDLHPYLEKWAAAQFGEAHSKEIAYLLARYTKYNARRKPEMLDARTYDLESGEWARVSGEYNALLRKADSLDKILPEEYRDAYFQLVLHPIKACANLYEMYYNVALNRKAYTQRWNTANATADRVKELYAKDSLITLEYHRLNNGKWNHLMSQNHIGYTSWQEPRRQRMPDVQYLPGDSVTSPEANGSSARLRIASIPADARGNVFFQQEKKGVSMEAHHFSRVKNANGVEWRVLPDHGRTASAITSFPVTAPEQNPGGEAAHVEYDIYTYDTGTFTIHAYFSPTLNFHATEDGLQYAISVDDGTPQIISLNKEDKTSDRGIWNKWAGENIIIKTSNHSIGKPGKHVVKYWMVNSGVVLQKLVVDFGDVERTYLGPEETLHSNKTN